jgi:hypothetical protein
MVSGGKRLFFFSSFKQRLQQQMATVRPSWKPQSQYEKFNTEFFSCLVVEWWWWWEGGSCVELFVKGRKTRRNGERRINPMPLSLAFPSAAVSARERERPPPILFQWFTIRNNKHTHTQSEGRCVWIVISLLFLPSDTPQTRAFLNRKYVYVYFEGENGNNLIFLLLCRISDRHF